MRLVDPRLQQVKALTALMAGMINQMAYRSFDEAIYLPSSHVVDWLDRQDEEVNRLEEHLEAEIALTLALHHSYASDFRVLRATMSSTRHLEHLGDALKSFARRVWETHDEFGVCFHSGLVPLVKVTGDLVFNALRSLTEENPNLANQTALEGRSTEHLVRDCLHEFAKSDSREPSKGMHIRAGDQLYAVALEAKRIADTVSYCLNGDPLQEP